MVALPVMALLAVAMASSIKLAARSIPGGGSVADSTLAAARALDLLAGDLAFATAIHTDVTQADAAQEITFLIPDRDGQLPAAETVAYSWSGVPNAPLVRTFNGTAATVAADVQEFELSYEKRVKTITATDTNTSEEILLISADGTTSTANFSITTSAWCGQFFLPLLPPEVVGWNVTKVQFMARINDKTTGQTSVQIRMAENGLPSGTVLDQQILLESALSSSYALTTLNFTNVPMQPRNQGLCLVLQFAANSPTGFAQYWAGGKLNSHFLSTTTSGTTWTATKASSLRCYVYGTVQTNSTTPTPQYFLTNVHCRLRLGAAPQSRLTTSIRVLNEPEVSGP